MMSYEDPNGESENGGFFQKNWITIVVAVVLLLLMGGAGILFKMYGKVPPPRKPEEIVVHLQPPPPMPPPPPPPPPPKEPPKMVEQPKDLRQEKPKDLAKAPDKAPGPAGPKSSGQPSDFGLASGGGGGGGGGDEGGGSRWGPYAASVQERIADALHTNSKTRDAALKLKVRVWSDAGGRITRAELGSSTGDRALDDSIKNGILVGLQLDPPPSDMPMPIVMMIREDRPN